MGEFPMRVYRMIGIVNSCGSRTASGEEIIFNDPHPPPLKAIEAFHILSHDIRAAIIKSRREWDLHEPKMWARASSLSDAELVTFNIQEDLVLCRSAPTSYGTIILGKIRLPVVEDEEGEGFVHVRLVTDYELRSIH